MLKILLRFMSVELAKEREDGMAKISRIYRKIKDITRGEKGDDK